MQAFFQRSGADDILLVYFPPQPIAGPRRDVLFVPPLAEEMNKARRMIALQARALAKIGIGTLLVDLYGTGDSQGDFRDARLDIWRDNLSTALAWLRQQGSEAISVLALRLGALLALDWAHDTATALERIVLWQPVLRGETQVNQFLRLRTIASRMEGGRRAESIDSLRQAMTAGDTVEVAGYELAPELVHALDQLDLTSLGDTRTAPIHWFELAPDDGTTLPLPSQRVIEQWRSKGMAVTSSLLAAQSFWDGQNITVAPQLLRATVDAFATGDSS
jgi:exosortase A-associated hydrolase 2